MLKQAFNSLLISSVDRKFSDWSIKQMFSLTEQKLYFRLSDEFDLIDQTELHELPLNKKASDPEEKKQKSFLISDDFQVQIDFNYINGVSPYSQNKQEEQS